MPLGGGGGGLGWGTGLGGGPGKGPGQGGKGPGTDPNAKDGKDTKDSKGSTPPKTESPREPIEIEILGGDRFKNDGADRYYLVLGKDDTARSLKELDVYLKQHPPSRIDIVHTADTALDNTEDSPTSKLRNLAIKNGILPKGPKD